MTTARTSEATSTAHERAVTMHSLLPLRSTQGGSQARSRTLGQGEHNVMLALGLVRAAQRALSLVEPKVQRACELALSGGSARGAVLLNELSRLMDELAKATREAMFEGHRLLDGASPMFTVDDAVQGGEPLRVDLPDLESALFGERGLAAHARITAARADTELAVQATRASIRDGKLALERAEQQLGVLLDHFHQQRAQYDAGADGQALARIAEALRRRVVDAGRSALAAQGDLSARTFSLVLDAEQNR
jgi:flagellin-like hook-associated protein FlgL